MNGKESDESNDPMKEAQTAGAYQISSCGQTLKVRTGLFSSLMKIKSLNRSGLFMRLKGA